MIGNMFQQEREEMLIMDMFGEKQLIEEPTTEDVLVEPILFRNIVRTWIKKHLVVYFLLEKEIFIQRVVMVIFSPLIKIVCSA